VKRELSGILQFDVAVMEVRPIALKLFGERKCSYSSYWMERMINDKS